MLNKLRYNVPMSCKHETQQTITQWAADTFGPCTAARAVARMLEEIEELRKLDQAAWPTETYVNKLKDECADVIITMSRAASLYQFDLQQAVDDKMTVNRMREWALKQDGTGYHIVKRIPK